MEDCTFEVVEEYIPSLLVTWLISMQLYIARKRNMLAFFIFGLTNNLGYVIMISAAFDLLKVYDNMDNSSDQPILFSRPCNEMSTGIVLLANILPSITAKSAVPFLNININLKISGSVLLTMLGLFLVALAPTKMCILIGVACVSLSNGIGESTLLAHMALFRTNVILAWSSGTGAAGLFGSLSYSMLMQSGLTPSQTIVSLTHLPLLMLIAFWIVLGPQDSYRYQQSCEANKENIELTWREKLAIIPKIFWKYTLFYSLVYLFEYLVNQGLFEVLQFPESFLTLEQQYRWYHTTYQLGVFASRSTMKWFKYDNIWLLSLLQFLVFVIMVLEVSLGFLVYLVIAIMIIFAEGCIGGAAYANTYRRIAEEQPEKEKPFSMSINAIGDSVMVSLAGLCSLLLHEIICHVPPVYQKKV